MAVLILIHFDLGATVCGVVAAGRRGVPPLGLVPGDPLGDRERLLELWRRGQRLAGLALQRGQGGSITPYDVGTRGQEEIVVLLVLYD